MEDFSYGGIWLSELGGRLMENPKREIAEYDIEFVEIPGRSGDIVLDKKRYKNVQFSRKIGLVNREQLPTKQQLDKLVEWLGYFEGYQTFRDTMHPNAFSLAVLTNAAEVLRELPRLSTSTLNFNRIPFWLSDEGQKYIDFPSTNSVDVVNPFKLDAAPEYRIYALPCNAQVTIDSCTYNVTFTSAQNCLLIDCFNKEIKLVGENSETPVDGSFPPDIKPREAKTVTFTFNSGFSQYRQKVQMKPNWRFL